MCCNTCHDISLSKTRFNIACKPDYWDYLGNHNSDKFCLLL